METRSKKPTNPAILGLVLVASAAGGLLQLGCGSNVHSPDTVTPEDIPALIEALKNDDDKVVRDAARALTKIGANTEDVIIALIAANTYDEGRDLLTVTFDGQEVPFRLDEE